jgi:hypothetical protein
MLVASIGCAAAAGAPFTADAREQGMTVITAADWYRTRPEPEQEWRGVLRKRAVPVGPAGRSALRYELVTLEGVFAVYDPGESSSLSRLVGQDVLARGKLVELTAEGFGQELWIAEVKALAAGR